MAVSEMCVKDVAVVEAAAASVTAPVGGTQVAADAQMLSQSSAGVAGGSDGCAFPSSWNTPKFWTPGFAACTGTATSRVSSTAENTAPGRMRRRPLPVDPRNRIMRNLPCKNMLLSPHHGATKVWIDSTLFLPKPIASHLVAR